MPRRIVMFAAHEPSKDPRIHWEADLASGDYEVVVCGLEENSSNPRPVERLSGYTIIREVYGESSLFESAFIFTWCFIKHGFNFFEKIILLVIFLILFPFFFILEYSYRFFLAVLKTIRPVISFLLAFVFPRNMLSVRLLFRFFEQLILAVRYRIQKVIPVQYNKDSRSGGGSLDEKPVFTGPAQSGYFIFIGLLEHYCRAFMALLRAFYRAEVEPDIIHVNDLNSLLVGVALKHIKKCKLVYDAHELWPVSVAFLPGYGVWFFKMFERRLISHCDKVFTVTPQIARTMESWYGLEKVEVLPNAGPLEDEDAVLDKGLKKLGAGRVIFLFQGAYAPERGLEQLIEAWRSIDGKKALLALRGIGNPEFTEALMDFAGKQIDEGKIVFLPPVSETELVAAAREADVGVIPYMPLSLNHRYCCPNKTSQYMQAGLALLSSDTEFIPSLIEKYGCGLVYKSGDINSCIEAINKFLEDREFLEFCKRKSLEAAFEFNWDNVSGPLIETYRKLAPPHTSQKRLEEDQEWAGRHLVAREEYCSLTSSPGDFFLHQFRARIRREINGEWLNKIRTVIFERFPSSAALTLSRADEAKKKCFTLLGAGPYQFENEINWQSNLDGRAWIKGPCEKLREKIYRNFPENRYVIGDIKINWELNKHLHFFELARAYVLSGDESYPRAFREHLESFWLQNPAGRNTAWMEPLIASQRVISWLLSIRFMLDSDAIDGPFFLSFLRSIHEHLEFISTHHEFTSDGRNSNHIVGSLTAVLAIVLHFPEFDISKKLEEETVCFLEKELEQQILKDGFHYEQSASYHRYVLEFLFVLMFTYRDTGRTCPLFIREAAEKMVDVLFHLTTPDGRAILLSDADGARVFRFDSLDINDWRTHFALASAFFGRGEMAFRGKGGEEAGFWLFGPTFTMPAPVEPALRSVFLPYSGLGVLRSGPPFDAMVTFDCGNIGQGYMDDEPHATHGHDDTLSLTFSIGKDRILVDPGSGSYTGNIEIHNALRVSMAHNVLSLSPPLDNGYCGESSPSFAVESHSVVKGPWCLERRARPLATVFYSSRELDMLHSGHDGYRRYAGSPFHYRTVFLLRPAHLFIIDFVTGREKTKHSFLYPFHFSPESDVEFEYTGEQFSSSRAGLVRCGETEVFFSIGGNFISLRAELKKGEKKPLRGWFARDYGVCVPSPVLDFEGITELPALFVSVLSFKNRAGEEQKEFQRRNSLLFDKGTEFQRVRVEHAGVVDGRVTVLVHGSPGNSYYLEKAFYREYEESQYSGHGWRIEKLLDGRPVAVWNIEREGIRERMILEKH